MSRQGSFIMAFGLVASIAAFAATPPTLMHYQGVLRDPTTNAPLTGSYDMVFHFFDAETVGNEVLADRHLTVNTQAVSVNGGLFSVQLGSGQILDGDGPGTYTSLADLFRDYATVYLEIQINSESLNPRVRVVSAAYAFNAAHVGGKAADSFLDTSATGQAKAGELIVGATNGMPESFGIEAYGLNGGAFCRDLTRSGAAYVGRGDDGIIALGTSSGGIFFDADGSGYAYVGYGDRGIEGHGNSVGGYFQDSDDPGTQAIVAGGLAGVEAYGSQAGGKFTDALTGDYAWVGTSAYGIAAYGTGAGGVFQDRDVFTDTGVAYVGTGDRGIEAYGDSAGGFFQDSDDPGTRAFVAGALAGIDAYGSQAGGKFTDALTGDYAWIGTTPNGIAAFGTGAGGYFQDRDFTDTGVAYVGTGDDGIHGYGYNAGGYFKDSNNSGFAYVGYGDRGIWGKGLFAGGTFSHPDNVTFWADVGRSTYKIAGTGTVSFVQNHPYQKDRVVVYAAPEGDEVAVYSRGTARLVNGEARVELGETFALVANPDIGLTAQVTPIGESVALSVVDKSTSELRVRGPAGSSTEFDYLVYGLRIGFERHAPVQAKEREAFLPEAAVFDKQVAGHADLESLTALSRFSAAGTGGGKKAVLARSRELAAAIDENRDTIIAAAREAAEVESQAHVPGRTPPVEPFRTTEPPGIAPAADQAVHGAAPSVRLRPADPGPGRSVPLPTAQVPSQVTAGPRATYELLPASGRIEPGDVLVLDPLHDGVVTASAKSADRLVVGCAAALEEGLSVPDGQVALAAARIALCRADASFGAIAVGDWLVTSPTPGHAMRVGDTAAGAILGKAAEPLEAGTGLIRVVVTLR